MAELVVLNGSSMIARSVVSAHLAKNVGKYASVKLIDARPYRQSVYNWQRSLDGVHLHKHLARNVQSIELALEGAKEALYFTHDYCSMASDKNSHLLAASKLAKKHGIANLVAVCPFEHDLAWSEEEKNFVEKAKDAEDESLQTLSSLTVLKPNLAFGPESHLIHFLTQCAIVGKSPYANLVGKSSSFKYAPIHTDDIASTVGEALEGTRAGRFSVNGAEHHSLRQIMNTLEKAAGKGEGSTSGPMVPAFDYLWDFFSGTTNDVNMSRMVDFYEKHPKLAEEIAANPWGSEATVGFENYYSKTTLDEERFAHPTMGAYKCAHLD